MIVMMLGMAIFWGLVVVGVVWLLREGLGRFSGGVRAAQEDLRAQT
jgi:hypothetical protein